MLTFIICSHRSACHDVSYPVQGQVRNTPSGLHGEEALGTNWVLDRDELDCRALPHGRSQFLHLT